MLGCALACIKETPSESWSLVTPSIYIYIYALCKPLSRAPRNGVWSSVCVCRSKGSQNRSVCGLPKQIMAFSEAATQYNPKCPQSIHVDMWSNNQKILQKYEQHQNTHTHTPATHVQDHTCSRKDRRSAGNSKKSDVARVVKRRQAMRATRICGTNLRQS